MVLPDMLFLNRVVNIFMRAHLRLTTLLLVTDFLVEFFKDRLVGFSDINTKKSNVKWKDYYPTMLRS